MIHSLADARVALAAARATGTAVTLVSAPAAAGYAGAGWFAKVIAAAAAEFPEVAFDAVLDCGAGAGLVMGALRQGIATLRFTGEDTVAAKLADIAHAAGAELIRSDIPALDLRDARDPAAAAAAWLRGDSATSR